MCFYSVFLGTITLENLLPTLQEFNWMVTMCTLRFECHCIAVTLYKWDVSHSRKAGHMLDSSLSSY